MTRLTSAKPSAQMSRNSSFCGSSEVKASENRRLGRCSIRGQARGRSQLRAATKKQKSFGRGSSNPRPKPEMCKKSMRKRSVGRGRFFALNGWQASWIIPKAHVWIGSKGEMLAASLCFPLLPRITDMQRLLRHVRSVPILLQKSFWGDERNFLGLLMRFACGDVRVLIVPYKNGHGPSHRRYTALQR